MGTTEGHSFEGIAALEIDTDAAAVRVEPTSDVGTTTIVSLTDKKGMPLDDLLELVEDGTTLRVKVRVVREGRWRKIKGIDARLTVTTPPHVPLSVRSDAGSVRVDRRTAPVKVEAHVGSIELTAITGDVEVRSDAGSIKLDDGIGNATVTSEAGSITVRRQQGERIELRATAGSVNARALEVATLEAHTDAGSVKVEHATPPVHVEASCSVGAITIELPRDEYDIEQQVTGLGRARLEGLEHVPGAARTIRVRSKGVGSVTVRATAATPAHA